MKTGNVRISRGCYDKFHRCPGWAGGGTHYPKRDRCDGGYITYLTTEPGGNKIKTLWKWRFNRCPKCGTYVLPWITRWLDPGWLKWKLADIPGAVEDWKYGRRHR